MALDKNTFNVMQNMGLRDIIRSPAKSILIDQEEGGDQKEWGLL